jgi:hypothetical protein
MLHTCHMTVPPRFLIVMQEYTLTSDSDVHEKNVNWQDRGSMGKLVTGTAPLLTLDRT